MTASTFSGDGTRIRSWLKLNRLELGVHIAQVLAGIGLISWVLWSCRRGIDFSDEGFYLNWISNPSLYKASHTLFGFIYHPLYIALGSDLVALRQTNILITLCLAWVLFRVALSALIFPQTTSCTRNEFANSSLALILATNTLGILNVVWIPTPSYNTLALQALIITGIGVVLARPDDSVSSRSGWALIGFGGWLAFMAKPTTALMLGILVLGHLAVSGSLRIRHLLVSLVVALLLLHFSAWYIDGSIPAFIGRLVNGIEDLHRLQGGYEISRLFRIDSISLIASEFWVFSITIAWLCLVGMVTRGKKGPVWVIPGITVFLAMSIFVLMVQLMTPSHVLPFLGLQSLAVPFSAILLAAFSCSPKRRDPTFRRRLGLVLFMLILPYAFSLGTNGNYWSIAAKTSVFWVLAGLLVLPSQWPLLRLKLIVSTIAAIPLFTTSWIVYSNTENPYRQTQPLRLNKTLIKFASGSEVLLSEDFAQYLTQLTNLTQGAGFKAGEPMLDWTGHYPLALHAIGAKPIGIAWLGGGYPGSNEMVAAALDRIPCAALREAWILTEPDGIRALSPNLLKRYGIDLAKNYSLVGELSSPTGTYPTSYKQYLWRPIKAGLR